MIRQPLLKEIFLTAIVVAVLHKLAISLSWYWTFWWMDVVMHFLGGLLVGLVVLWFVFVSGRVSVGKIVHEHYKAFFLAAGGALVVGLAWELFELYAGVFTVEEPFPDSLYDLIFDTLGGMAAYLYVLKHKIVG